MAKMLSGVTLRKLKGETIADADAAKYSYACIVPGNGELAPVRAALDALQAVMVRKAEANIETVGAIDYKAIYEEKIAKTVKILEAFTEIEQAIRKDRGLKVSEPSAVVDSDVVETEV